MLSAVGLYGLAAAPLQISNLRIWVESEDNETATDALASVLASRRFQRHSGVSLRVISSPTFILAVDSAAALPQLTHISRLDVRTMPSQLPAGLKELVLAGDEQQLTRLPADIISTWPQLKRLTLYNMAVDVEQLQRSLSSLHLIKCAVHSP